MISRRKINSQMTRAFLTNPRRIALIGALIILVLLVFIWRQACGWYRTVLLEEQKNQFEIGLSPYANSLAAALERRLGLLEGLWAHARVDPPQMLDEENFDKFVYPLYTGTTGIRNFSVAPRGVQMFVYPLVGNEDVIGHDLINDSRPDVRSDVQRAVYSRHITLSDPYILRQNGLGLVARKSVYQDDSFWGLVCMVLDLHPILGEARLDKIPNTMEVALRDNSEKVFYGSDSVFQREPIICKIDLPEGSWKMAGAPKTGWNAVIDKRFFLFQTTGLTIIGLLGLLSYLVISRQAGLAAAVQERTKEISRINLELQKELTERKRWESALRKSEIKYRLVVENLQEGICMIDRDANITYVNNRLAEMLGYTSDEMIGKPLFSFMTKEDIKIAEGNIERCKQGVKEQLEWEFDRKDGEKRYFIVGSSAINDEKEEYTGALAGIMDITDRKKAEEALRLTRYSVDIASTSIFWMNSEGKFIYVNEAACRRLGYTYRELLEMRVSDIDPNYPGDKWAEHWKKLKHSKSLLFESHHRTKDGKVFPVEINSNYFKFKDKEYVFSFSLDITERKKAELRIKTALAIEKTLHEIDGLIIRRSPLEEIYHTVCRGAVDMGYLMAWVGLADPDHVVRPVAREGFDDGYLEKISVRWDKTLHGAGPSGTAIHTGKLCIIRDIETDLSFTPWKEEALRRGYRSVASIPLTTDTDILGILSVYSSQKDGFDPEEINSLLGFSRQITIAVLHRNTYEELEQTRERLQTIFDNTTEGIALVKINSDGKFMFDLTNRSCKNFLGGDKTGKIVEDCFPDEIAAKINDHFHEVAKKNKPMDFEDEFFLSAGGQYLKQYYVPIPDQNMIIVIVQDITEEKEREKHLQRIQRLDSVGRLAGGVAHDFNNLVTVIIGYAQLSSMTLPKNSPLRRDLEEIQKAAKRAGVLTRQLLAFARRQVLESQAVDLNAIIRDIHKMLQRVIGEHIEIRTNLEEELRPVMADPGQVEQVIMNLCLNARDAMPGGGKLILETNNEILDQEYANRNVEVKPGEYVKLIVRDNGCGMSPEVLERIFEPFFTTKPKESGTGLGLSTVYGIVKQHGGHIRVYSKTGKGSTFLVYFPVAEEKELADTEASSAMLLPMGTETVLLVEDEKEVLTIAFRTLSKLGYKVSVASDADEALRILSSRSGNMRLIITDIVMPKMNGFELARNVKERWPEIKILFISGYSEEAVIDPSMLASENFLTKPFSPGQLAKKVREVLNK